MSDPIPRWALRVETGLYWFLLLGVGYFVVREIVRRTL